ncbi:F-box domain - like 10 [Theobroma cacao]|nr:F-box domain - like 10 [Theobroma cacao]
MGKKSNQLKQGHDPDGNIPRNTARDSDVVDLISSLHDEILHQIIPLFLHKWRHPEKEHAPDNLTRKIANNLDPNDFISRLPDNIFYHIISFLPFQSAVRTTFLSTQWKDLWKEALWLLSMM